jgi:hypothetical protein
MLLLLMGESRAARPTSALLVIPNRSWTSIGPGPSSVRSTESRSTASPTMPMHVHARRTPSFRVGGRTEPSYTWPSDSTWSSGRSLSLWVHVNWRQRARMAGHRRSVPWRNPGWWATCAGAAGRGLSTRALVEFVRRFPIHRFETSNTRELVTMMIREIKYLDCSAGRGSVQK